jgi:hypothetical protein
VHFNYAQNLIRCKNARILITVYVNIHQIIRLNVAVGLVQETNNSTVLYYLNMFHNFHALVNYRKVQIIHLYDLLDPTNLVPPYGCNSLQQLFSCIMVDMSCFCV